MRRARFPLPPLTEAELRAQVDQAREAVFPDWDDYSPQAQAAAQRYSRLSDQLREMQRKAAPIPHYNFYVRGRRREHQNRYSPRRTNRNSRVVQMDHDRR